MPGLAVDVHGNGLLDALGTAHKPVAGRSRIVCLVPSITELLFDLGLADQIVGRTRFCTHPAAQVARVARVGGTKTIKLGALRALAPTHVIINVDENPKELLDQLRGFVPNIIVTHPIEPEDNLALYRLLGGIFQRQTAAERLCRQFETALRELRAASRSLPRRRVLYLIWKGPWMTVSRSTYIARMLSLVRWQTVGHDPETRYPIIDVSAKLLADTDILLFSTEPYPFQQTHVDAFRRESPVTPPLMSLIDAQMTAWYGSRAISGLAYLGRVASRLAMEALR